MKYYDIALFDVDPKLQKRLGYSKIYSAGRDLIVQQTPKQSSIPTIIKSKDTNILMRSLKENGVVGIVFEDNFLIKKVIEKAAATKKTIFLPISYLFWKDMAERQSELHKIRKIIISAHSLKAKLAIITLADSKESLVSKDQMQELAKMLLDTKESKFTIFGGEFYDN